MRKSPILKILIVLVFTIMTTTATAKAPKVCTSIKPIHSLVSALLENIDTPCLLIPNGASPHDYQLKPSQVKKISQAELLVWIGPQLESHLKKAIDSTSKNTTVLTLMLSSDVNILSNRWRHTEHDHDHHNHDHDHDHDHDHHSHNHGPTDPHIWLSLQNMRSSLTHIKQALIKIYPEHEATLTENHERVAKRLGTLDIKLKEQLKPYAQQPFLVYHDAYQYFEQDFNLQSDGVILGSSHTPICAKRLKAILDKAKERNIQCVFSEPEFNAESVQYLFKELGIELIELDPLGARIEKGPTQYEILLQQLADKLSSCLAKQIPTTPR